MRRHPAKRAPALIAPPALNEAGLGRHPHLTPEERQERTLAALHEAAHFVVGLALGASYHDVFIRVPDVTPKNLPGHRGGSGFANVHAHTPEDEAVIHAAAILAELALWGQRQPPEGWESRAASDIAHLETWEAAEAIDDEQFVRCLDRTLGLIVDHWLAIDGAAAAFLELDTAAGVVKHPACVQVARWVSSGAWRSRRAAFGLPGSFAKRAEGLRDGSLSAASFIQNPLPHAPATAASSTAATVDGA